MIIELVVSNFDEQTELFQGTDINLVRKKGSLGCIALFSDIYRPRFLLLLIYLLFIDGVLL
jgi:hypothetical protein